MLADGICAPSERRRAALCMPSTDWKAWKGMPPRRGIMPGVNRSRYADKGNGPAAGRRCRISPGTAGSVCRWPDDCRGGQGGRPQVQESPRRMCLERGDEPCPWRDQSPPARLSDADVDGNWCGPASILAGRASLPPILQSRCLGGLLAFHRQWMNGISLVRCCFRCALFYFHTHIGQYRFQSTQAQHDVFHPA